jgi:hypothetical protein
VDWLKVCRFLTMLFAGLGLALGTAHVLELPPKMAYDADLYAAVTSTLYRLFGSVGAAFQIGAVVLAAMLAWMHCRSASFPLTLAGFLALLLSLSLWAAFVAPVNAEWLEVMRTTPHEAPAAYAELRERWEYGHVAAFVAWFAGYSLLVLAVLTESSPRSV